MLLNDKAPPPQGAEFAFRPAYWAGLSLDRPRIMGVLNVTPDSFSDGGLHETTAAAIRAGMAMAADGADIIDIGGESTRPGAVPISLFQEQARILPVIHALASKGIKLSVDTRNADTMRAGLDAGAAIINDVSGLRHDPGAARVAADRGCPVVLMHMRGNPQTMNALATYQDPVREVAAELAATALMAEQAGIRHEHIALDPGIGFAKLLPHSVAVLRGLRVLGALGYPLLVGVSRKSFIGHLSGEADPARRLPGSLAAALFALSQGCSILRVHDVRETAQAVLLWHALTVQAR